MGEVIKKGSDKTRAFLVFGEWLKTLRVFNLLALYFFGKVFSNVLCNQAT